MSKLSIIVPVYNVSKFLCRCIESVYSQTFDNWEMILIDDGSTDDSGLICDRLADNDSKIKVIHQANAGLSAARNTGLKHITGEYVTFIDSDDFLIDKNTYMEAIKVLSNDDTVDIVQFGFSLIDENGATIRHNKCEPATYHGTKEYFYHFANICGDSASSIKAPVWMRIYRSHLFNKVRFREGVLFEDAFFDADIFFYSKGITLINTGDYGYVCNPSSIMGSAISHKKANDATMSNIYVFTRAKNAGLDNKILGDYYFKIFHEMCCVNHIYGIQFDKPIYNLINRLVPKSKTHLGIRNSFIMSAIKIVGSNNVLKMATAVMAFKSKFITNLTIITLLFALQH